MIVSASRRTDIPAFYADWFFNRIKEGYVLVRNPMNIYQVSRISLLPAVVDCFVFWTKNPSRMMGRLHLLNKYNFYFQYTITSYGKSLEPNVPARAETISTFQSLSDAIGKDRVIWRYDPIILSNNINIDYHVAQFDLLASSLGGYTQRCVISFLDLYKKCERNLKDIKLSDITIADMRLLAQSFKTIAQRYNLDIVTCSEQVELSPIGIHHGKCIDDKLISEISGRELDINKDKTQREECGCVASIDIGSYNTCSHGCLYCYANYDSKVVKKNIEQHDVMSPLLYGSLGPDDKVNERKISSCFKAQQNLFADKPE
jgi:hypothetical protein